MINFLEQLIARIFNRLCGQAREEWQQGKNLDLGLRFVDEQVTKRHLSLGNIRRAMHVAVLGKTGTGKSSFLRYLMEQDIEADRGFLAFDFHGDLTLRLLRTISARERRTLTQGLS
jgi:DNA helicase HerA-like ATPase